MSKKITLTDNQIETLLEALDFWQGSLIGVEEYASEYRRALSMEKTLLAKVRKEICKCGCEQEIN